MKANADRRRIVRRCVGVFGLAHRPIVGRRSSSVSPGCHVGNDQAYDIGRRYRAMVEAVLQVVWPYGTTR